MDDEDIAKARPESTRVINLMRFADVDTIDPIYVEGARRATGGPGPVTGSAVLPRASADGKVAGDAFGVLREALRGKAGLGKMAILGREYLVAVQPRERGLMMFTLRQASEVRQMSQIEELDQVPDTVNPDEIKLAQQVIGNFAGDLDLSELFAWSRTSIRASSDASSTPRSPGKKWSSPRMSSRPRWST